MSSKFDEQEQEPGATNRRTFLRTSGGVATGLAVTAIPTGMVALSAPDAAEAKAEPAEAVGDVEPETVMAYLHDSRRGIVTVVHGTHERTYRDPALARRLADAAAKTV